MKRFKCLVATVCFFILSGCGKNAGKVSDIENTAQTDSGITSEENVIKLEDLQNGDYIKKQLTNEVLIEAAVRLPECGTDGIKVCHVKNRYFNGKEMADRLFPQISEDKWKHLDHSSIGVESAVLYSGDIVIGNEKMECGITIGGIIGFYTEHWTMCEAMFPITYVNDTVDDKGNPLDEDLPFESRESIEKKAKQYLANELGCSGVDCVRIYSMKHQQLQENWESYLSDPEMQQAGKPGEFKQREWSDSEDCYWLIMEQGINGIPLLSQSYIRQDEVGLPSGKIEMGYTSNGLECIKAGPQFEILEEENVELADMGMVLETLRKKFDLTFSGDVVIDEMKLIYFPYPRSEKFEYDFIPAWSVKYQQGEYQDYIYVDAVSGKEIVE